MRVRIVSANGLDHVRECETYSVECGVLKIVTRLDPERPASHILNPVGTTRCLTTEYHAPGTWRHAEEA